MRSLADSRGKAHLPVAGMLSDCVTPSGPCEGPRADQLSPHLLLGSILGELEGHYLDSSSR